MFRNYFFFGIFYLWLTVIDSNPIVNTTSGVIEGKYISTWSGRPICAFLGIPYANTMRPHMRLTQAKMSMAWKGIYPAKEFGKCCIQMVDETLQPPSVDGGDDCLFLNIFTPVVSNRSKLNVIFFIHGGGFIKGRADIYTPDFIMDQHNVVFVTANYRLGPLGFLSTEDDVIPGNFGLKDQVLALRWVRKNIDRFGGDKDKITLMGEDAGAVSVHLHYMSFQTRHMFKQGISLSGSAFVPWALTKRPRVKAIRLAKEMGCNYTTSQDILECFQKYPYNIMLGKMKDLFIQWNSLPLSPFGPVIEKKSAFSFLHDHPHNLIEKRKFKDAPWLVGLTSHEGLFPGAKYARDHNLMEEIDERWDELAPVILEYNNTMPQSMRRMFNDKIRQYYFEDNEISVKLREGFIAMLGDRFFVADTEKAVRLQASLSKKSQIFVYRFSYRGRYSNAYYLCQCSENMGACHGDDLLYLFNTPGYDVTETKQGLAMMRQMVDILISFVESGVPKTDPYTVWKPVQQEAANGQYIHYMDIVTTQNINLEESPDLGNRRFWNDLHNAELKNTKGGHKRYFDEL